MTEGNEKYIILETLANVIITDNKDFKIGDDSDKICSISRRGGVPDKRKRGEVFSCGSLIKDSTSLEDFDEAATRIQRAIGIEVSIAIDVMRKDLFPDAPDFGDISWPFNEKTDPKKRVENLKFLIKSIEDPLGNLSPDNIDEIIDLFVKNVPPDKFDKKKSISMIDALKDNGQITLDEYHTLLNEINSRNE